MNKWLIVGVLSLLFLPHRMVLGQQTNLKEYPEGWLEKVRAKQREETPWGEESNGLKTRITLDKKVFQVGEPIKVKLEMKNCTEQDIRYPDCLYWIKSAMEITDSDNKTLGKKYHGPFQTSTGTSIIPAGKTIVKVKSLDLHISYYIPKSGEYQIRFRGYKGSSLLGKLPGTKISVPEIGLPESNTIEINIIGEDSKNDAVAKKLGPIFSKGKWRYSFYVRNMVASFYHETLRSRMFAMGAAIYIWRYDDPIPVEEMKGSNLLGKSPDGHIYIKIHKEIIDIVPDAHKRIAFGLGIKEINKEWNSNAPAEYNCKDEHDQCPCIAKHKEKNKGKDHGIKSIDEQKIKPVIDDINNICQKKGYSDGISRIDDLLAKREYSRYKTLLTNKREELIKEYSNAFDLIYSGRFGDKVSISIIRKNADSTKTLSSHAPLLGERIGDVKKKRIIDTGLFGEDNFITPYIYHSLEKGEGASITILNIYTKENKTLKYIKNDIAGPIRRINGDQAKQMRKIGFERTWSDIIWHIKRSSTKEGGIVNDSYISRMLSCERAREKLIRMGNIAIPFLMEKLERSDPHYQMEAIRALKKITGQDFGFIEAKTKEDRKESIESWKDWWFVETEVLNIRDKNQHLQ